MANSIKPFELLAEYERLSLQHNVKVEKNARIDQWSGVGFKVGEVYYALAINKIVEVLILTDTTKIPGIARWVLGLGNIRGNLIPIVDLKSYLFDVPTKITAHTRMVIITQTGGQVGLVVDEVFGQKHFDESMSTEIEDAESKAMKYTEVAFTNEGLTWNVLDDDILINDPSFQNAADK